MPISPNEAADVLRDVNQTERRSAQVFSYRIASPYLILWGVLWAVGYGLMDFRPDAANFIWLVTDAVGLLGSILIARRNPVTTGATMVWRLVGMFVILFAFVGATYFIMRPTSLAQSGAFSSLIVAACYAGVGLWMGLRMIISGAAIAALTLGGYFFLPAHFLLWMAFVGGGALILGGLWLRRA